MVFIGLVVISITVSEVVARYSLPATRSSAGPGDNQGIMTILIPFKILNSFFLCFQMLETALSVLTYLFISWLDAGGLLDLNLLDVTSLTNAASETRSSSVSWTPTLMLVCLLASMSKAKAHTWRKLDAWWEEHQLTDKCRRVKRIFMSSSSRRAAYQVDSDPTWRGAEQFGMEQRRGVQGRQETEAGRKSKLATTNIRGHNLAERPRGKQSEETKINDNTRQDAEECDQDDSQDVSLHPPTHRVIMVRPVDDIN